MESRIFVCLQKTAISTPRLKSLIPPDFKGLIICPSDDRFNDFGTISHIDIFAIQFGIASPALSGKLLVADPLTKTVEIRTSDFLRKMLAETPDAVLPIHQVLNNYLFLTALIDSEEYEKLINIFGPSETENLLHEINDVGLLLSKQPDKADLIWFQTRPEYGQSLLRSDSTFLAVFDLPNQLSAIKLPMERSKKINLKTSLIGKGKIEFSFMADALGVSNVNVIVGVNGVGKSRLLRELACANETLGPILFLPSPLDDADALPSELAAKVRNHPATAAGWESISRTVALITRDQDRSQYRILRRAISGFIELEDIALPLIDDTRSIEFTTHKVNGQRYAQLRGISNTSEGRRTALFGLVDYQDAPIFISEDEPRRLSSGERALFGLAATLIRDIPKNGLVLLDEPELSLHPSMIADLMRLLGLLLKARQAHCIIATHSLFIIRETPDAAIHVLKRSDIETGTIIDYEPMIQTLGAGLTELSNVIFDDWNIKEYFQQRIEEYLEKPRSDEELSQTRNQLGETARAVMFDLTRDHKI